MIENQPTIVPLEQLPQTDEPKKKKKPSSNILSKIMKELMEERDIKLAQIQKATGIAWSTLHGWYDGDVKAQILDEDLLKVARFFNVTLEYLAFGIGDDSPAYGKFENGESA
jgi:DNA phosphorothioation-dependent restriction protein DptG